MITIFKVGSGNQILWSDRLDRSLLNFTPEESIWVDLEDPTSEEASILSDVFKFHPLAIEDCLAEPQHPKLDIYDGYIFMVLHGINWQVKTGQFTTAQVDIFLGGNFLITHHRHKVRSVMSAIDRCRSDGHLLTGGLDLLLYTILDRMVDNYIPELEKLDDKIDALEDEVFTNPTEETLGRIFQLKREVMHLKRIVYPQREVFNRLSRDEIPYIRPTTRLYFRDIYDSLFSMADSADAYRDLLTGILDAYLSSVSNRLNQIMKILTIITTIFMPMNLVTGIYGMNFESMPGLASQHGFYVAIGIMLAFSAGMLVYFKLKGWF